MKVLVCGSRTWRHATTIEARIRALMPGTEIIHGAGRGADSMAANIATRVGGFRIRAFPAAWASLGKSAGIMRNIAMLDERPDLVIAFWDGISRGTMHTITEAQRRSIPVEIILPPL